MTAQHFRRSRKLHGWFAVLAALPLCLKALVPTGYMIAPVDGHARLVMCPAGIHQPSTMHHGAGVTAMDAAGDMHMAHVEHPAAAIHAAHAAQHAAADCPFALAAAAALAADAPASAEPYFILLPNAPPVYVASFPAVPPLRHHAPRGPPSLA